MLRCQELGIDKLAFNVVVKVTLADGKTFVGDYTNWTSEGDNEPDSESISIVVEGITYEVFLPEIESVEAVGAY
jgi:hypothetical protein